MQILIIVRSIIKYSFTAPKLYTKESNYRNTNKLYELFNTKSMKLLLRYHYLR